MPVPLSPFMNTVVASLFAIFEISSKVFLISGDSPMMLSKPYLEVRVSRNWLTSFLSEAVSRALFTSILSFSRLNGFSTKS